MKLTDSILAVENIGEASWIVGRAVEDGMEFNITKEDLVRVKEWETSHKCSLKEDPLDGRSRYVGAIGGATGYKFIPTGLGDIVIAFCACGEELDLTDYDTW